MSSQSILGALRTDVQEAIRHSAGTEAWLQSTTDAVVARTGAAFARIWTLDETGLVLELKASSGQYVHLNGPHSRVKVGQFKIGLIAAERRPHVTNDVPNDPRVSDRAWARREGMRAFAGYPLLSAGRLHGVLALFSRADLSEELLEHVAAVADLVADELDRRAIAASRSEDPLGQSKAELAAVNEQLEAVTDALTRFVQTGDLRRSSVILLHAALVQTRSEYGFVGSVVEGAQGPVLRVFADEGFWWDPTVNRPLYEKIISDYGTKGYIDFPSLDNLFGRVILEGQAIISNSPETDPRATRRRPTGHPPLRAFLGVPMLKGAEVVGMFGVANREGGYTGLEQHRIETLSRAAAVLYDVYLQRLRHSELQKEQDQTKEQLKEAVEDLQHLARTVSHELQDPLGRIRGYLTLLQARYQGRLGEDADTFIGTCVQSAALIERMIGDLWTYARTYSRDQAPVATDARAVAASVVAHLHDRIAAAGARVVVADLPAVGVQSHDLTLVFGALIDNAIRYRSSRSPEITITARTDGAMREFSVQDNGRGIESIYYRDIFKLFFRLDARPDPEGTGMGLAISRKIVQQCGGRMWVESVPGEGSTFRFTLPAA